ncbi:PaaI family thioesterase [Ascidiaceihabitans sp.]|uniref:PaaI family thioesterase n=1 Tax=Ascidiaceihabitans sp. TaxID=1872644 RepID=UPI003299E140
MTPEKAQAILDENFAPWVRALDPRVTKISSAGAVLEIPITDQITRMGDIVSGQTMATLADTAMVFACIGDLGTLEPVATVTLDTQFLRPGSGRMLRAEASVTRTGKAMIFTRCVLTTWPGGKDVAHATATFARPAK